MADLIDRQAVMQMLHEYFDSMLDTDTICPKDLYNEIEALPSAQLEHLDDDEAETIRIIVHATIETLCNQHRWDEAREIEKALNKVIQICSTQPSATDIYVGGNLIDRQAALDIYDDYNIAVENGELESYRKYRKQMLALPSAQQTVLTAEDIETIRIHLSAFKEELGNQGRWTEAAEYERLIQRLTGKGGQDEENAVR